MVSTMRELVRAIESRTDSATLGAAARSRSRSNAISQVFARRFVASSPADLWRPLQVLEEAGWSSEQFLPIHYYAAATAEPLLWDFVLEGLAPRLSRGELDVTPDDALRFIESSPRERFAHGRWSDAVSRRVAQGVLVTLKDFGVLTGRTRKRLRVPHLPIESFAFLARLRASLGIHGPAAIHDEVWRLFFLSDLAVERLFLEAHQERLLTYHAAGSIIRIDFPGEDLPAYAHELADAERAHRMARI
jgi:hypothetical protein